MQGEFKSGSTQDLSTFFFNLQTPNLQVKIKNGISYQVSAWFMNIDNRDAPSGGQGEQLPPQILADQKAPPGSGGAPHYYLPPGFLTLGASLISSVDILHDSTPSTEIFS